MWCAYFVVSDIAIFVLKRDVKLQLTVLILSEIKSPNSAVTVRLATSPVSYWDSSCGYEARKKFLHLEEIINLHERYICAWAYDMETLQVTLNPNVFVAIKKDVGSKTLQCTAVS